MKRLIINVDDLGLSYAVNEAVVQLAEKKRISATSYMVGGAISTEHKQELAKLPIEIGLHLDFTGIFPSPLTNKLTNILIQSYARQLDKQQVHDNIAKQFDDFEDCFGCLPVFVDGHQHVHQFPIIRDSLIREMNKRSKNNSTKIASRSTKPLYNDLKSWIIYALGGASWSAICKKHHISTNTGFLGVYGFDKNYQELANSWQKWLTVCPSGVQETTPLIMCHPAVPNHQWHDEIKSAREIEYQWLMSDEFAQLLTEQQIQLAYVKSIS